MVPHVRRGRLQERRCLSPAVRAAELGAPWWFGCRSRVSVPFQSQDCACGVESVPDSSCANCHTWFQSPWPECDIAVALWFSWRLPPLPLTRVLLCSSSAAVCCLQRFCTGTCLKLLGWGRDVPRACGDTEQPPLSSLLLAGGSWGQGSSKSCLC